MPDEFLSMSEHSTEQREAPARKVTPPVLLPNRASAALDRIEIPQDVVDRVSELLTPASSVIISDYGISHETGKNTDFIVVTH